MSALKGLALLAALIAVTSAVSISKKYEEIPQQHHQSHHHHEIEYTHHPKYKYEYAVHDSKTHDVKKHTEQRDGDKTEGEYSFQEADGTIRTVKYYVDGKSGFVATVHHSGKAIHPNPIQHHQPIKTHHHSS